MDNPTSNEFRAGTISRARSKRSLRAVVLRGNEIAAIALPASVHQLFATTVGFIDVLMISSLGSPPVTAISLVNSSRVVFLLIFYALASASAVILSFEIGRKNTDNARMTFSIAVFVNVFLGSILSLSCYFFPRPIMYLLNNNREVVEYGEIYVKNFSPYFLLMSAILSFATMGRAVGITKAPMIAAISALTVNVIINYIVIWETGLDVDTKIRIVAYATVFSRVIEFTILFYCIWRYTNILRLTFNFFSSIVKQIAINTLPIAAKEAVTTFGALAVTIIYARIDSVNFAALAVTLSLERMLMGVFSGAQVSATILVSRFLGRRSYLRTYITAKFLIIITFFLACLISSICFILIEEINYGLSIIQAGVPELQQDRELFIKIVLIFLPVRAVNVVMIDGILRAARKNTFSLKLDAIYYWIIIVPLCLFCSIYTTMTLPQIFAIVAALELVRFCVVFRQVYGKTWLSHAITDGGV